MRLYDYESPSPRRVRVFMAEKGLAAERVRIDLAKGEHRTPDFLAKNPLHAVPVLETDEGAFIAESVAICRYLDALQPEPPLFGATPLETGLVEMWLQRVESQLMRTLGTIWIHDSPLTGGVARDRRPELAADARKQAARAFALFDAALQRSTYLAGERFTAADIMALCTVDFGIHRQLARYGEEHPHVARWHALVSARPSAAA